MSPDPIRPLPFCQNPNYIDSTLRPAVERRMPARESVVGRAFDHISGARQFFETVSRDLCDDGRMGIESAHKAVSFISRSSASAAVISGTIGLATLGVVFGSPLAALGLGVAGLALLPPLAERCALGIANFAGELLDGVRKPD
jgi:hypothetical protein